MSDTLLNPIVLFGNIGPDVVRLSQIYDPDNDQYKLSEDNYAVISPVPKQYWLRSYADKVVTFTQVPPASITATSRPNASGWYEINVGHEDQTGKYVPAVASIVVVDTDSKLYKKNTILTVESVDDQLTATGGIRRYPTFKSVLVPVRYGTGEETSARSLDYGNDRFMLYFERQGDADNNIRLMPDRKLMLYGDKYYVYKLVRGANEVISAEKPVGKGISSNEGYIPFIGATECAATLNQSTYQADTYAGKWFSYFSGTTLKRFQVPAYDAADTSTLPTLDGWYKSGVTYILKYKGTDYRLTAGRNYHVGDSVGEINITAGGTRLTKVSPLDIHQYTTQLFNGEYTGWIDRSATKQYVYYPGGCWLQVPTSGISNGEVIRLETYEYNDVNDFRLVMSVNLTAKEGVALDAATVTNRNVARIDVKLKDEDDSDVFPLSQKSSVGELMSRLQPYLVYDNGDVEYIAMGDPALHIYGQEAISIVNAGREYKLLFKYFRSVVDKATANVPKTFISCSKTVRIVNDSASTIRRISLIPCWKYSNSTYVFKYAVYDDTFSSPMIVDNLDSLLGTGTVVGRRLGKQDNIKIENCLYKDDSGFIRPTTTPGTTFGYVQHGDMAMYISADGYANSIYSQTIGYRLIEWTTDIVSNPVKWLIGDDEESTYSASVLKYGNDIDLRPYFNFYRDGDKISFQLGNTFLSNGLNSVIKSFYLNALTSTPDPVTPTHMLVRGFFDRTYYMSLDSTTALEGIVYYNSSGTPVPKEVGDDVTGLLVRRQDDIEYYVYIGGMYRVATNDEIGTDVGAIFAEEKRQILFCKYTNEINSGYIPLNTTDNKWREPFELPDAHSALEVGGSVPEIVDPDDSGRYNVQVMGIVLVEFCALEGRVYKHLYGVPVEVRWPYAITTNQTYGPSNVYYVYDPVTKGFVADPNYVSGGEINHASGRACYIRNN